ncbi:hypothetical protein FIBSPDRAFT_949785 [Athelia psychrophila]|uniref:Uncharacterized protein n=1 Tax=Athelia psychrophila TaxID=1759441 RepID=A0A166PDV5_9AGAM|nr:hypothetical protein FIBSPDRAFT_949785 [Fibularhizoctonia sp. CBS 109695]
MLRINEAQQHRAQVLLKHIDEYRVARIGLVQQLEELDALAEVVQREFSVLQNSLAPIGCLPEEVLAMVFEAGTHLEHETGLHFAVLVSHVTRSWRNIALATPRLWATIRCRKTQFCEGEPYPEAGVERTAAFLARSGSSPMDLHFSNFLNGDLQFLQRFRNNWGRCQHLSIKDVYDGLPLPEALTCLSRQQAPFLESFQFVLEDHSNSFFEFEEPLFPSGVPHLKTAQLNGINIRTFHFCLGALQSVTSLSLIYDLGPDDDGDDYGYTTLRASLMALPSLIHLELQEWNSVEESSSRRPLVLPTLQSLRGYSDQMSVLTRIHAAYLTVLILEWNSNMVDEYKFHFPSLQHLVLLDVPEMLHATRIQPGLIILGHFPSIERLTFQNRPHAESLRVDDLVAALGPDVYEDGNNGHHIPCPRLRTLALAPSRNRPMDVAKLASKISRLQSEGIPIGKLMLPENLLTQAGADLEAFAELRKCVEIVDFRVDWSTPFDSERFVWSV